jgi:hypothetical protein
VTGSLNLNHICNLNDPVWKLAISMDVDSTDHGDWDPAGQEDRVEVTIGFDDSQLDGDGVEPEEENVESEEKCHPADMPHHYKSRFIMND